MDFQETFLALFWPVWSRLLGLFVAVTITTAIYVSVSSNGSLALRLHSHVRLVNVLNAFQYPRTDRWH